MKWFTKYLQKLFYKRKKFSKELQKLVITDRYPIADEMEIKERNLDEEEHKRINLKPK